MKLDVFDTHARTIDGRLLHFDVLQPSGGSLADARRFAYQWLEEVGVKVAEVELASCRFCHSETPTPEIQRAVSSHGFFVLQMEGCPSPV
ncbi:MAG: DUF2024 family protein [bacterium]